MRCIICNLEHDGTYGKSGKYCSKTCRYTFTDEHRKRISMSLDGVKKPYMVGIHNPNYKWRCFSDPLKKEKFLKSVKTRGQCWNADHKLQHSARMMGDINWMRGKHHSEETKEKIRERIVSDISSGKRVMNKTMVSVPEKDIAKMLSDMGYGVKMGIRISNKLYDIFVPEKNLIIEFNGDYWHMNPNKYSSDIYNKACGMTAAEIWKRDENKNNIAIQHGYFLHCVWEDDYKKSKNKLQFLKEIISKYEK